MKIKLKQIQANLALVQLGNMEVFFSYETPVVLKQAISSYAVVTDQFYSATTTGHIKKALAWLAGRNAEKAISQCKVSQAELEALMTGED